MLCYFSAVLECHAPWTWWTLLTEADQAKWFGAWSAAAAFLGGLYVYWHGKRIERENEDERRRVLRIHQALRLQEPLLRASKRLQWIASKLGKPEDFYAMPNEAVQTWKTGVASLEDALVDPAVFSEHTAIRLIAFIDSVRGINRIIDE